MNQNTFLGIIGLSLLVFVAAFAIGRLNRPTPNYIPKSANREVSISRSASRPAASSLPETNTDLVTNNVPARGSLTSAPVSASAPDSTEFEEREKPEAIPALPTAKPAAPAPAKPSPAEIAAAKQRAEENRIAIAARRAHADQLPDDFKKYYAQELPEDAISEELDVQARVAGAKAEVITLTSPAFNETNKDFVIQQVRSELTELGFKQVYITDGKGFRTKTRL
jgi:hypothetical protein